MVGGQVTKRDFGGYMQGHTISGLTRTNSASVALSFHSAENPILRYWWDVHHTLPAAAAPENPIDHHGGRKRVTRSMAVSIVGKARNELEKLT